MITGFSCLLIGLGSRPFDIAVTGSIMSVVSVDEKALHRLQTVNVVMRLIAYSRFFIVVSNGAERFASVLALTAFVRSITGAATCTWSKH